MLIPHHGSKTSSSPEFLAQVSPHYAIASYGFDNRYHFPHEIAVKNYEQQGIPIYNTTDCGMVRVDLNQGPVKPLCYKNNG
jgi:competence protein ComEC